jgi:hypothetical protein
MNWLHFLYAVLLSTFVASMTDWLFMGDLWMRYYKVYPEAWRQSTEGFKEGPAIAGSMAFALLTCAAVVALAHHQGTEHLPRMFHLAILLWLGIPLPLIYTQSLFMKLHRMLAFAQSAGWLIKLLLSVTAAWLFKV